MNRTMHGTLNFNNYYNSVCATSSDSKFRRLVADICDGRTDREVLIEGKRLSILVVEDDELSALVAIMVLKEVGACRIDLAVTGKEALELIENNRYDVIFMDFGLPDIYGNEIVERIRLEEGNKNKSTPIITLTAQSHIEIRNKSAASGMNDYIVKPITAEKAREMLCRWVYSDYFGR